MPSKPRSPSAAEKSNEDPFGHPEYLIGYRLHLLDGLLGQHAKQITRQALDMNRAEWYTLLQLAFGDCESPHEIAHKTGMERSHVTAAIRALVERDLVSTERDPGDGRRIQLGLTKKGTALVRRGVDAYAPRRAALAAALTPEERAVFDTAVTKLIRVAEELLVAQQGGD